MELGIMGIKKWWRNNPIRRRFLHAKQKEYLNQVRAEESKRVIIFLVPGKDRVNGGVISIISLAEESAKLKAHHGADVFACTMPDDPTLLRFTKFANQTQVVDLTLLLSTLTPGCEILVHIPEIFVGRFGAILPGLVSAHPSMSLQFNILLQNIDGIPPKSEVHRLQSVGTTTCTTAHKAYCNETTAQRIGCPVHLFSVWVSPEKYLFKGYEEKEKLVVLSPDKHPRRSEILASLQQRMPGFEFRVIKNMTYEQYKALIAKAKFSVTFGEGLDAYLVEPVFSGGIGAAVFNSRFFTDEMVTLPFIYRSFEELEARFPEDAALADRPDAFHASNLRQFQMFSSYYSHDGYIDNLRGFYETHFSVTCRCCRGGAL